MKKEPKTAESTIRCVIYSGWGSCQLHFRKLSIKVSLHPIRLFGCGQYVESPMYGITPNGASHHLGWYTRAMLHLIIIGLLLGWGAAIPIGPLNLEIIRRNLHFGALAGTAIGLGACSGDITYLILLSVGALAILTHAALLKVFGVLGALILVWFAYQSLTMKVDNEAHTELRAKPLWRHYLEGYALIMVSPYTVLFWLSVSSQIATYASSGISASMLMGVGVILGVTSWCIGLNLAIHHTKHRLSAMTMQWLNRLGGIIILGFAVGCLVKVFS